MPNEILALNELGWGTVATALFLLVCALPTIWQSISKFVNIFGIETKWTLQKKANDELLIKLSEGFDVLKNGIEELDDRLDSVETSLKDVGDKVYTMEEKNDARKRAELKERIAALYRIYHERQSWTKMEKEAFEDLISAYEKCKHGNNSFVHEICQVESLTWKIIDEDIYKE